jgi:hypothetical protein
MPLRALSVHRGGSMIHKRTLHILARVELGLRTNSTRLMELEHDLAATLARARGLGVEYGSPGDWNVAWGHHWDQIENTLARIHARVHEIHAAIGSTAPDRLSQALAAWEALQTENAQLMLTLSALHGQAVGLNTEAQRAWDTLEPKLAAHQATIHACSEALRLKLEVLKAHSNAEVEQLVESFLARLPNHAAADAVNAETYEREYQQAASELTHEKHTFLGLIDVVKNLFMWEDTAAERTDKNLESHTPQVLCRPAADHLG